MEVELYGNLERDGLKIKRGTLYAGGMLIASRSCKKKRSTHRGAFVKQAWRSGAFYT